MTSTQILIVATIIAYLVGIIMVGVYFSRKNTGGSSSEFYLGGRQLGPLVTAMSERALMYDWCLRGGEFSLHQYAAQVMPGFLSSFWPEKRSENRIEKTD